MDAENTYCDVMTLAETTNSASTTTLISDIIDHGSASGRGRGPGRGAYLVISVDEIFVGPSTAAVFLLEQSASDTSWSATTLGTYTASIALTPAGEVIAQVALPTITQRYTRITGSWSTAATGAGSITAKIDLNPQASWA